MRDNNRTDEKPYGNRWMGVRIEPLTARQEQEEITNRRDGIQTSHELHAEIFNK